MSAATPRSTDKTTDADADTANVMPEEPELSLIEALIPDLKIMVMEYLDLDSLETFICLSPAVYEAFKSHDGAIVYPAIADAVGADLVALAHARLVAAHANWKPKPRRPNLGAE
ncbi:Uu.00g028710.m01.CDS01 [Anthostomella pinea]|uniref:Uu.00g028710.m01.CDS01 n=1 Tax=Anthostomella pinea TaxID=933095 RepID=A0AAI8V353_9PEZI|nr:Uu.00g028710.m01.CDS01 [Anthostomella pinea]